MTSKRAHIDWERQEFCKTIKICKKLCEDYNWLSSLRDDLKPLEEELFPLALKNPIAAAAYKQIGEQILYYGSIQRDMVDKYIWEDLL